MSKVLDPNSFGEKLYNSLPQMYRKEDEQVEYALKRFLSVAGDGGFSNVIKEYNGILDLNDPEKTTTQVLNILFKQYGFEVFNGIPEVYLRKLLPILGDLYSRKGSTTVIEYLTSIVTDIKTEVSLSPNFKNDFIVNLRFEMDYDIQNFPNKQQIFRIIKEFVPFFLKVVTVLVYMFYEYGKTHAKEYHTMKLNTLNEDHTVLDTEDIFESYSLKNHYSEDSNLDKDKDFIYSTYIHTKVAVDNGVIEKDLSSYQDVFKDLIEEENSFTEGNIERNLEENISHLVSESCCFLSQETNMFAQVLNCPLEVLNDGEFINKFSQADEYEDIIRINGEIVNIY